MKIATCGAAASTALIKKFSLCVLPSVHASQEQALKLQQEKILSRQLTWAPPLVEACQQAQQLALEQLREQTFPVWFDLRSYLALLFVRCLRVGDPALLSTLGIQEGGKVEEGGTDQSRPLYTKTGSFAAASLSASGFLGPSGSTTSLTGGDGSPSTFPKLLDDLVLTLLSTAELPAAAARAGVANSTSATGEDSVGGGGPGGGGRAAVVSPLLQALSTGIPVTRYADCVTNWYLRVSAAAECCSPT